MSRVGRKVRSGDLSAGEVFAQRMAEVRRRRGWTQTQLAARLKANGFPIHRVTLAKIEKNATRARRVSLEEVLAISYTLGVSPIFMFVPLEVGDPGLIVTGDGAVDQREARDWVRGEEPLPGQDLTMFVTERPHTELSAALSRHPSVAQKIKTWRPPTADPNRED